MDLISYASDFTSFLIQNFKEMKEVRSIILFGSAARNEAEKSSDVDIFVDVLNNEKKIEKEARKIIILFFDSVKFKNYWKPLGVENEINLVVGDINKWKLKDSMLGNAIVLYQRYAPKLDGGKSRIVLHWGNVKPESKRVLLDKKISGYNYYGKRYAGLLEKYQGKKLGAGVIIFDAEYLNLFLETFHRFNIPVRIIRVFEYKE